MTMRPVHRSPQSMAWRRALSMLLAAFAWCCVTALQSTAGAQSTEEEDRWVKDARAEWPAATGTLQMMGGRNALVLQVGSLRSDWNSGALIIMCDRKEWSFDSVRMFRLTKAWGEYIPFRLVTKGEGHKAHFMATLREIAEVMEKDLPPADESTAAVGGVDSSGGCVVYELAEPGQFRQFSTNRRGLKSTPQMKSAIEVLHWWFATNVSLLVKNPKIIPQWNGKDAPALPVEFPFHEISKPDK